MDESSTVAVIVIVILFWIILPIIIFLCVYASKNKKPVIDRETMKIFQKRNQDSIDSIQVDLLSAEEEKEFCEARDSNL